MNKYLKRTLKGFGILIGLLIVLYSALYIYVISNKQKIIKQVTEQVSEKLNGTVTIKNVELSFITHFPNISVEFDKVMITDTMFAQHRHPFFIADRVYAKINVWKVVNKQEPLSGIRVDKGSVYFYTDTSGYTNMYLLSPKKQSQAKQKPSSPTVLKDIELNDVRFVLENKQKDKLFDFSIDEMKCKIKAGDSVLKVSTRNKILIHNLAFNLPRGAFVKETSFEGDFDLTYNTSQQLLSFDDIDVDLKGHPFNLTGNFNFALRKFALEVVTKNLDYNLGKSFLTAKIQKALALVSIEKKVDVKANLVGDLAPGDPNVKVEWSTKNNIVHTPFLDFANCSFTGGYTNELVPGIKRSDPNSRIYIHAFSAEYEGIPIKSNNIYIDDLINPMINCDVKTNVQLTTLNNLLQSNTIIFNQGSGALDIVYSGPLTENNNRNTFINGNFSLTNGSVLYAPRGITLKDVNGHIVFKNTDVFVTDFKSNVQGNKISMNGAAKNLLSFLKTNPGRASLNWSIYSPAINLEAFTALLQQRKKAAVQAAPSKGKLTRVARQVDNLLDQANISLDFKADKIEFKKFTGENVRASINLTADNYILNKVSLTHGNGSMLINGYIKEKNSQYQQAAIKVNMLNVDVNKVLYAFNNFGQDAIKSENLQGKLTSNIDVRMDIDRDLKTSPQNIEGFLDFSLKNGALINFEPIQKLQNFLFKNRDFGDIRFAELKDRFDLKNRDIVINRMEIQSTALSLFVEGIYSLKGNTDISIQVPVSNLKKRSEDYKPENLGTDVKGGTSVFVRGRPGEDGNIKFKYDMFKKFRKDKDKAAADEADKSKQ